MRASCAQGGSLDYRFSTYDDVSELGSALSPHSALRREHMLDGDFLLGSEHYMDLRFSIKDPYLDGRPNGALGSAAVPAASSNAIGDAPSQIVSY
ncbi:hypothetical protein [Bifidobacterium sp.]|uniref:hypothetical protein n=1 Tax=Bifidobacterium sp. TaxID=41200 RepID=UPI0025B8614B|nr:hypothetical protein [Bifidobacterium sp.]MCI1225081.1 hypothetical protein [Bifidobacterium sp.]